MANNQPIEEFETTFLRKDSDLIAFPRRDPNPSVGTVLPAVLAFVPFTVFGPFVATLLIPGLWGRVFVIALTAIAQAAVVWSAKAYHIMSGRAWIVSTAS